MTNHCPCVGHFTNSAKLRTQKADIRSRDVADLEDLVSQDSSILVDPPSAWISQESSPRYSVSICMTLIALVDL